MKVAVDYGDKKLREVEVHHTVIMDPKTKKPKEIYRSVIHTNPVSGKRCIVIFDPASGEVKVKEV